MKKSTYVPLFRRKREGKTNYRARRKALLSRKLLAVVRLSNKYLTVTISKTKTGGDEVVASAFSKQLVDYGWNFSFKSIPAAYLTGLLCGLRAVEIINDEEVIFYSGVLPLTKGGRVAAALKGLKDAGVNLMASEKIFPDEERLKGLHIAKYAELLKKADEARYLRAFSGYLDRGVDPREIPEMFEKTKNLLLEGR